MYNGEERRQPIHVQCKYEDKIVKTAESVIRTEGKVEKLDLRINGAMDKIAVHMEEGVWYRRLVIGTAVSLVIAIFGGIYTASQISATLGRYMERVDVNTQRWNKLIDGGKHTEIR